MTRFAVSRLPFDRGFWPRLDGLQLGGDALVPRCAHPWIAVLARGELVWGDAGEDPTIALRVIDAEPVWKREMSGRHCVVHGNPDDGARPFRREARVRAVGE